MDDQHEHGARLTSAEVNPKWLISGQPFEVVLNGWEALSGQSVEVHLSLLNATSSLVYRPLTVSLDETGYGKTRVSPGFDSTHPWSVFAGRVVARSGVHTPQGNPASLLNWPVAVHAQAEIQAAHETMRLSNLELHSASIGEETDSTKLHRAVFLFTGLRSREAVFPGFAIIPTASSPTDQEHVAVLNEFLKNLHLPVTADEDEWARRKSERHPTSAVLVPRIWASDFEGAHALAMSMAERLRVTFALHTRARPQLTALVLEQRQRDDSSVSRVYPFDTSFAGVAADGTSPRTFEADFAGVSHGKRTHLAATLFTDAVAEPDDDFAFFRLWSVLETLARHLTGGVPRLLSGAPWPYKPDRNDPAPAVYALAAAAIELGEVSEGAVATPAADLFELVQCLKARRNATAHYGGFFPDSTEQQRRAWFADATKTAVNTSAWRAALTDLCVRAVRASMRDRAVEPQTDRGASSPSTHEADMPSHGAGTE